jgi:hypothetical protein
MAAEDSPTTSTLRSVIDALAVLERGAGSPDERLAAELLAEEFAHAGATVQIDEEQFRGPSYARLLLPLGLAGLAAGHLVAHGRRLTGGLLAAATTAALVDDVENGKRVWRRLAARPQPTWNVVAECGDASADRTLVVLGHHDAAPTGLAFDPSGQRWLAQHFPALIQRTNTSAPFWWPIVAGPILTVLAALSGRPGLARVGTAVSAVATALGLDIARHRIVPGANDNLSGSAALVALAERLRDEPVSGIRVVLASCGAEEVLQGGIYGFVERHLKPLDPSRTWVLNLDTIGSPELLLVEGEGPFRMQEYRDRSFRDRIARVAQRATGAPIRRGVRARASSDAVIPSRAGYPTAMLGSWEPETKCLTNYHLLTDTPDGLSYETIERAVVVAEALARDLAA